MSKGRWYTHPETGKPTLSTFPTDDELDEVYYEQVERDWEEKLRREREGQENIQPEQEEWESDDASAWG